ncbi:hypothetical protein L1887_25414 [Cichorium endivia]|nr:hypothetical protein L1887_25414 [Cichorium endivia]
MQLLGLTRIRDSRTVGRWRSVQKWKDSFHQLIQYHLIKSFDEVIDPLHPLVVSLTTRFSSCVAAAASHSFDTASVLCCQKHDGGGVLMPWGEEGGVRRLALQGLAIGLNRRNENMATEPIQIKLDPADVTCNNAASTSRGTISEKNNQIY